MPEAAPNTHDPGTARAVAPDLAGRVLDSLPDLVFAKDPDGRYLHVNRAFAEALGRPANGILGRTDADLQAPEDAAREASADRACLARGAAVIGPDSVRAPLRDPAGRPVGVAGAIRARPAGAPRAGVAADRRGTNGRPPGSSELGDDVLAAVVDALPVGVYAKNADGTYAAANGAFARLLGAMDPGEVIGRRDGDFGWRPLDHGRLDEEVLGTGLARHGVARREVDRFARRRWTETSVVPRTDELGRVCGVVGIRMDVTARHETMRQAERARGAAEQASRAKSGFLTQMSHELRTPLTALLGFAELALEPEAAEADRRAHLERIRDNGWQVLALVDDLLDLSRIEAGRLATRDRAFPVRQAIGDLVDTFRPRLQAAGMPLHVEIDDAVPEAISSDPIRFRQILASLLERARREVRGGTVTLRATVAGRDADATLAVEITDEGPSLDAEALSRRLTPFEVDDDASGRNGGGLGLAVAWGLADLLGGRIEPSTGPEGRGTRFVLRLPLHRADSDEADAWSPIDRAARDPWQRVEAAARDGVAWFAPPPDDLDDELDDELDAEPDPILAAAIDPVDAPASGVTGRDGGRLATGDGGADARPAPPAARGEPDARPAAPRPTADVTGPATDRGGGIETGSVDTPAPAPTAPAARPPGPPGRPDAGDGGLRILLAEDTPDTARFLVLVLRSRGHEVEHEADGEAALAAHRAAAERGEPFDVVLTDVQMPRMDGHTLARRLREDGWDGPIVALTAHASGEHRRDALAAGCDDHIAKPVTPDQLQATIRRHAGARRRAA